MILITMARRALARSEGEKGKITPAKQQSVSWHIRMGEPAIAVTP